MSLKYMCGSFCNFFRVVLLAMSFDSPQNERRVDANKKALARSSGAVSKVPFNTVIACNVLSQKLKQVGIKRIFSLFLRWLSPR